MAHKSQKKVNHAGFSGFPCTKLNRIAFKLDSPGLSRHQPQMSGVDLVLKRSSECQDVPSPTVRCCFLHSKNLEKPGKA